MEGISSGLNTTLVAHSQGAIIVKRALDEVREQLAAKGLSAEQIDKALTQVLVITVGGASRTSDPSSQYLYVSNTKDTVPSALGVLSLGAEPSADSVNIVFSEKLDPTGKLPPWFHGIANLFARYVDNTVHGFEQVYLPAYEKFVGKGR